MECTTDIRQADAKLIGLLIDCSIQAYNAFAADTAAQCVRSRVTSPEGFDLLDCWSGVDAVFGREKTVETYGLVFRSTTAPWRYIFAFRGTDSTLDMLDDSGVDPQKFVPFDAENGVPEEVRVESGFNDIYKTGDGAVTPMQHQLFDLIDRYRSSAKPIDELYITGHSLGAALCQLFMLDLALCRPTIATSTINFASPRVGNGAFVRFIEASSPYPNLRVQNTYDAVPHLPPAELGFEHTPAVYLIAFHCCDVLGELDLKESHSSINYKAVIKCASESDKGICQSRRLSVSEGKTTICSELPNLRDSAPLT